MTVIGETLRRERLRRNLQLDEISRELKISHKFLEAIEDERFDLLPRGVFAKSFVRQYARYLGLDEEELAGEVQKATEPPPSPQFGQAPQVPPADIHVPRVEAWENISDMRRSSSLPALAMVVVAMLVCSGVYALWQRSRRAPPPREDAPVSGQTAQSEPPRPQTPQTEPAPTPATKAPGSQSAPVQSPNAGIPGRAPGEAGPPVASAPKPATPAPTTPAPEPGTQYQIPNANPHGPVQLTVTADELVWVLVKTDGKFSFTGTMEAQQTKTFDAAESVTLRLGNAGGVSIKVNGQPVGPVGPKGQVRTVQFTSGGFQIVAVPKPALPDDLL